MILKSVQESKSEGMKKILSLILFSALLSMSLVSCVKRINCDESNSKKIGTIQYSQALNQANIEEQSNSMTFTNGERSVKLSRAALNTIPHRLNDHIICEEIDIKPYIAYAYYEYVNKDNMFSGDSITILFEPIIEGSKEHPKNLLYINLAYGISSSLKGGISFDDKSVSPSDIIHPFELQDSILLRDKTFKNIWVSESEDAGIYYSLTDGIVAIKMKNEIWLRER